MESKQKLLFGGIAILIFLLILAPFADPNPDGLESAAGEYAPEGSAFDLGVLTDYGSEESLLYQILRNDFLSVIVSGLIGVIIAFSIFFVPIYFLRLRKSQNVS